MEKRKLASVQYVHHITPIEGADRIECVHVLGWQCVANKGQFQVGDSCVYMEVDSFLPVCERFEFLRSSSFKRSELLGEGFRLKTQKFRGQISQGLVQPLSILPKGDYQLGDDVTELLGIRKWEVEERVKEGDLPDVAIQGEFCGAGIQKNRLKLVKPEWYVFTVIDLATRRRYSLPRMKELCEKLGLSMVPIEEEGESFPYDSVDVLLERAKGKYASGMNKEGIVTRPVEPVYSKTIEGPLSMKVLNNDYLLKE